MILFPAIDLKDGKCVRLKQGDFKQSTSYNESPLEQAKIFEDSGVEYLHCVDLDGALKGNFENIKSIEQIKNIKQTLPSMIKEKTDFYQNKSIYFENLKKFDIEGFNACKSGIKKAEDEISNIESKQSMLDKQIEENDALILNTFFTLETNLKSASSVSYKIITE